MEKMDGLSMNIEAEARERLKSVFPECFAEGELDIDKLLTMCGEYITNDFEKYKFEWHGKGDAMKLAQRRSAACLRPCPAESVDFDTTQNLYIEGDNLEVLRLLQTAYFRQVKMIYIDPPYNTGNDFVYEDDFKDPLAKYLEVTSQATKSNPETMGRFHTAWLNMMYPRLRLAANLLRDDGVIFISIDDNEVFNLKKVCDEVFGEENFRNLIVVRRGAKSVQAQFDTWDKLGQDTEYLLFYTKSANYRFPQQRKKLESARQGTWNNHWRGTDRPTMRYELFGITPESGQWRWGEERSRKAIQNYETMLSSIGATNESVTQEQIDAYYTNLDEEIDLLRLSKTGKPEHYVAPTDSTLLNSSWYDLLIGSSSEISDLFETKVFDTAKLTAVIERMLGFCDKDSIILDFFSGSGTTAHAVMQLNAKDGGNRRFICVQLPEITDEKSEAYKAGYKNICEIGKERIRRAGAKIQEENNKLKSVPMLETDEEMDLFIAAAHAKGTKGVEQVKPLFKQADISNDIDVGFKVFKLDSSNLKLWDGIPVGVGNGQMYFDKVRNVIDGVKDDRPPLDVVYELMLKLGVPLTCEVMEKDIMGKTVYSADGDLLLFCLEPGITAEFVEAMADLAPAKIILAEMGFADDTAMANAHYILQDKGIEIKLV